jgi:hypothetical protein
MVMGRFLAGAIALCAATTGGAWLSAQAPGAQPAQTRIRGFSDASSAEESARERDL